MTLLASADFDDRLAPRSAPVPQEPDRAAAAEVSVRTSAAFSHFTETCGDVPSSQQAKTALDIATPVSGAVIFSEHSMILLRAIAAYEECSNEHAVARALADYARKIGAGPLARAVLDELQRSGGP